MLQSLSAFAAAPLSGVGPNWPRLHRVVPPSLGLSRPECGTMVGIQSRRM